MRKFISKLTLAAFLTFLAVAGTMTVTLHAQETNAPAAKPKGIPFRGTLGAVDKAAMTITLEEKTKTNRVFQVTSSTKIMKAGKPATLDDGVVGDPVRGSYMKNADGSLTAKSIYFGAKKPAPTSN